MWRNKYSLRSEKKKNKNTCQMNISRQTGFCQTPRYVALREKQAPPAVTKIRQFVQPRSRLASFQSHFQFKRTDPQFSASANPRMHANWKTDITQAEKQALQARILETTSTIKQLENDTYWVQCFLQRLIPADLFDVLLHANSKAAKKQSVWFQTPCSSSFWTGNLRSGLQLYSITFLDTSLTWTNEAYLTATLNFNVGAPPNAVYMACAAEETIRKVTHSLQSEACSQAIAALSKLSKGKNGLIAPAEQSALSRLQKDKDIMFLPADKGNAVVVMDHIDYVKKMDTLLE